MLQSHTPYMPSVIGLKDTLASAILVQRETEARKKGISSEFFRQSTSEEDSARFRGPIQQPLLLERTASSRPGRAIHQVQDLCNSARLCLERKRKIPVGLRT